MYGFFSNFTYFIDKDCFACKYVMCTMCMPDPPKRSEESARSLGTRVAGYC